MSNSLFRKKSITAILRDAEEGLSDATHSSSGLKKVLKVRDLTAMGIAAVVGAGIFSTIGNASFQGGPGVILLFMITAVCCGFSALCYAEFASRIPVSGSAYTYAYAAFGELIAWIIGWDLLMEYAIGNIAVAISWSQYFTNLMEGFNIHIPTFLTTDYLSAYRGYTDAVKQLAINTDMTALPDNLRTAYQAWITAPRIGGLRLIADLPALAIVILITWLVYVGIRETRKATNLMVGLKIVIIIVVIAIGFFYVAPANWSPFLPNGFGGMMKGVSAVFFAYIGFDAISTTAEECENPQRDLPKGMIYSLVICTVLYILIAIVLTGMVSYKQLQVGDPLAFVFKKVGLNNLSYIISFSAVIATASVLLVFQMGQPRIWMSMSRDGLLPKIFSRIHPKYKTPSFSTVLTGFVVAVPALFLNLTEVTDLTSIGTLFAFVLVCGGVLLLPAREAGNPGEVKFKIPYINARYVAPVITIIVFAGMFYFKPASQVEMLSFKRLMERPVIESKLNENDKTLLLQQGVALGYPDTTKAGPDKYLQTLEDDKYNDVVRGANIDTNKKFYTGWKGFQYNIPSLLFYLLLLAITIASFVKNLSLIPVLGLMSCFYLMTELTYQSWERFIYWLIAGLVIFFFYSRKNSRLGKLNAAT